MEEVFVRERTLPEAYHKALIALQNAPVIPCPDWNTEQKEVSMTFVVTEPLGEPMISRLFFGDPHSLEQYRQEMLDGIMDFEIERGNWVYTYHSRYAAQSPCILRELQRNPWSRRAVMDIRTPEDIDSDDPACWQHAQYFIRDGALHCKILFRSNDACKANYMNAFALIMLQKRLADALGVPVGTYTHRANSFHCYARDFELLEGYIQRIRRGEDVTYDYEDDWDELMEEERPAIAEMVRRQREKGE